MSSESGGLALEKARDELAAYAERERELQRALSAAAERERALIATVARLQLDGSAGAGRGDAAAANPGRGPALRTHLVSALMDKRTTASGFALAKSGLDAPVGWMLAAAAFLPVGRIFDEVSAALADAAAKPPPDDFLAFRASLDLAGDLWLSRSLETVPEKPVQLTWGEAVQRWWPNTATAVLSSATERPETFPVPLVLSSACEVDFLRKVVLGDGAGRQVAVVAVAELKNSSYSPLNGVPQALVAAFSAAVDLRAKGLPAAECVVPFLSSNGVLEQHGVAYLLEPNLPCAAMTTPVLDLSDPEGQRRTEAARWAFRRMADRTTTLLQELRGANAVAPAASLSASSAPTTSLDASRYHIKAPLHFVGSSVEQSVLQQLRVFDRLRRSPAAGSVVLPAAVLMQDPTVVIQASADAADAAEAAYDADAAAAAAAAAVAATAATVAAVATAATAATAAGKGSSPRAASSWRRSLAVAFPMLTGFSGGVPEPGDPLRPVVLTALRGALRRVHRAGVVHLDLFPGNILWSRSSGAEGSGGAAAAGAAGASVELRLVDFDAALEVGQRVPASARGIVERNGHTGSYHPEVFAEGARARADFDWWHFSLLADADCPFSRDPTALPTWLGREGAREGLLAQVAAEVAAEEADAAEEAAGDALPVARAE